MTPEEAGMVAVVDNYVQATKNLINHSKNVMGLTLDEALDRWSAMGPDLTDDERTMITLLWELEDITNGG